MSRFSNEPSIRALLYEQFNARLCLVDIYYIYKQLEAHLYHNQEATLLLPVAENTNEIAAQHWEELQEVIEEINEELTE